MRLIVSYFNAQFTAFRVTAARERTCQVLMKANKSMIPFDQRRAYIMQEESARNFSHLSRPAYTYNAARRTRTRDVATIAAAAAAPREDALELSFIISPGQVGSAGIMQLFRCHNLKSWSIRPRHGRNQRHPGVTSEGRRGWALITDGVAPGMHSPPRAESLAFGGEIPGRNPRDEP